MEGHKVNWNTNVPYEDLVKQCPFLSQRALPLDKKFSDDIKINEVHISKSKKKRLKKKLKAISSGHTDISHTNIEPREVTEESEKASNPKIASVADTKQEKEIGKSKRVNDVVDGEISLSHPKVSEEHFFVEKETKKKIKQQKKEDKKSDNILVAKQGKSGTPKKSLLVSNAVNQETGDSSHVEGLIDVSSPKVSNINVSKEDYSQSKAQIKGNEKSREEIFAQREAKKKSKQLKKQKEIDTSQDIVVEKQSLKSDDNSCCRLGLKGTKP